MAVTITTRPIVSGCNWNAAGNPIVYKLHRKDSPIDQINNSGGFIQVQKNGSDLTSYFSVGSIVYLKTDNLVYDLLGTVTASSFSGGNTLVTLNKSYISAATTGYLNNNSKSTDYKIDVELFRSSDNTSYTDGVKISFSPDSKGLFLADVSAIIKNFLSAEWSNPASTNEVDEEVSQEFYIKYQEYYDGALQGSVVDDVANPLIATFAAMQVGSVNGGNMLDYFPADDTKLWLTKFQLSGALKKAVVWRGWPFTLSFIWPGSISTISRVVKQYNAAGVELSRGVALLNTDGDKIHRLKLPDLEDAAKEIIVELTAPGTLYVDSSLSSYSGWANAAINTVKWLFSGTGWGFTIRTLRSGIITPTILNGSDIDITLTVSQGEFKSTTVVLRQSAGGATQTVNFGDISTGAHVESVTTNANYDVIDITAQCTEAQLTNGLTTVSIAGGVPTPINLDNNTFTGSMAPWFNQGASTNAWTYFGNQVSALFDFTTGDDSKYLLELLDSPLSAGDVLKGEIDITPGIDNADVDIVLWDGVTYQVLDTIPVTLGSQQTYLFNGIASINATHFGFTATRTDGLTSPAGVDVSRVTLNEITVGSFTVPDSGFANIGANWTQITSNFPWTQGSGEAQILLPSSSFSAYFLGVSTSDTARKTISIPDTTSAAIKLITSFIGTGVVELTVNLKNAANTVIHTYTFEFDSADGSQTTLEVFTAGDDLTTIDLIAEAISGSNFSFKVDDIEVFEAVIVTSPLHLEVRDVCDYDADFLPVVGKNPIHLFWKNSVGGDAFWNFPLYHEYTYTYNNGRKAKRIILFDTNVDAVQWEALNELNTVGEVYSPVIQELTSSVNATSKKVGQQVYIISQDGTKKTGVLVLPATDKVFARDSAHMFSVEIELPEVFSI